MPRLIDGHGRVDGYAKALSRYRRGLGGGSLCLSFPQVSTKRSTALYSRCWNTVLNCKLEIDKDKPQCPLFAKKHAIC
jgi:hypothetical protein